MEYPELIKCALAAQKKAFAPYSRFKVGAALVTNDNTVVTGCNVEASSYSLSICAERVALFKAISEGHKYFKAIAIVSDGDDHCPPCGACRQVLWDLAKDIDLVKDWGFLGSTRIPSSSFEIISGIPPTQVATIGFPQAITSGITVGKPSLRLGRTKMSQALIH